MEKGLLTIISGPSGVGKGTVRKFLMDDPKLNLVYSVSCTTRAPRENEVNGVDYFFISKEEFEKGIEEGKFLEYAVYCGNYYGTPKAYVDKLRGEGKNVMVEIDTQGAQQLINKLKGDKEISLFIAAPSFESLVSRIRGRKTECECIIKERLEKAKQEMKLASLYDFVVINTTPEQCANDIIAILKKKLSIK